MKNIHKYIMLFIVAFAVASCTDDEVVSKKVLGQTGDDVQFGLSLKNSRTVYGDGNVDEDGQVVSYPIYWVDGDKVLVFSPDCLDGRRGAEYKVILPTNGDKAYYAEDLEKTGDFGVQWGEADQAVFYSLYPSGAYGLSDDGTIAKGIVVNYSQNIIVDGENIKSDMEDCLLYAKADGGEENDWNGVPKGEVVNLQYNPITTVFRIKLNVPSTSADDFTIQSVSITANGVDIAGKFGIYVEDGTFAEWGENKARTVSAAISDKNTGGFYTIKKGNSLEIPLFLAPVDGLNTEGWKIEVKANNKSYIKTLDSQDVVAGQIHHITLPDLYTKQVVEWDVATWMKNIPRNVYLSEISIPGSWNSLNPEFQVNTTDADGNTIKGTSITSQYTNGVRAFHLDTRWQGGGSVVRPTIKNTLGVANGGNTVEYTNDGRVMTDDDNPSVESALDEIIENIKLDEYMVLMCTFAQGSHNHSYTDDNGTSYDWAGEISRICSARDDVYDAKELTSNTLVGDVLGKVIVIVNMEGSFTTVPSNSKCIFINAPLTLTSNLFGATLSDIYNKTDIKKGTVGASTVSDTGIDIYNTQAQVCISGETYTDSRDRNSVDGRGFAPTFGERKTVANNILDWSKKNYGTENYSHDKWIYLGLGGYYMYYKSDGFLGIGNGWKAADNGHKNVASDCNTWINGKVTEMGTTPNGATAKVPYYPVGIVLMNYVNTYASTVKNILLLNNKYRLQYDPKKPVDYDPNYYESGTGDDDNEVEEGI